MKGIVIKCLQCGVMTVYKTEQAYGHRCPECNGITIPYGECRIILPAEEEREVFYVDGKATETITYIRDGGQNHE